MLKLGAFPSISEPDSVIGLAVSSAVLTDWLFATGVSLAAATVINTVTVLESTVPSLTLKVKLSGPL
jgi:hypothetical protein